GSLPFVFFDPPLRRMRSSVLIRFGALCGSRLLAMPPASAERLEQRRRIGVTRGLHADQCDARDCELALRFEQGEIARAAELELLARELQPVARERLGFGLSLYRARVLFQGAQRIGDVAESLKHRVLVLGLGGVVRGNRRATLGL